MNIKIYSTQFCPYCVAAKELCSSKDLSYEEIDLGSDHELRNQLAEKFQYTSVPMIVIDDKFIGGFTDLQKLDQEGGLK